MTDLIWLLIFFIYLPAKMPDELSTKSLDIALILHADHELNASTFAARVAAATLTDMYSASNCRYRHIERTIAWRRQSRSN